MSGINNCHNKLIGFILYILDALLKIPFIADKNGNDSNLANSKPDTSLGANLEKVSLNKDEAKPAFNLPRVRVCIILIHLIRQHEPVLTVHRFN